ncbi:MAG: alanine racemase [Actinomycetota bacterium]
MSSHNRTEALVDLGAIKANIKMLMAKSGKPALAVVKADAYGHGLVPVARAAIDGGATWLGVALLEEALTLRANGVTAPIIAWLTPVTDDFASAISADIDIAIPSREHLQAVIAAAHETKKVARVHLEIDSGMSRGGALLEWDELLDDVANAASSGKISVIGMWSHFARADEPGNQFNTQQRERFQKGVEDSRKKGIEPEIVHLSNSAATINDPAAHFDLVRLGIAMYGLSPDVTTMGDSQKLGLVPALSLRARIHLVKEVPAGSQVGYGGTAITKVDTKLAVIAMGYADGVPRNASSQAGVLIGNKMSPIIGRVSMDQFVVELGIESQACAGDWAYLIGRPKDDSYTSANCYTADSWAAACGTINYEIVTRIGPRVDRVYLD